MTLLSDWLDEHAKPVAVPLFAERDLQVETLLRGERRVLRRHPIFRRGHGANC